MQPFASCRKTGRVHQTALILRILLSCQKTRDDRTVHRPIEYDPYGGAHDTSGLRIDYGYTSHTWDTGAGLYYAAHRYYSPSLARWTSRDPLGMVEGLNVYEYASDDV